MSKPDSASLAWQGWSPLGGDHSSTAIRTVWDANYAGIDFPKKATVVLRIRAPHRLLYWRASTLDLFTDDRWVESLFPVEIGSGERVLPPDPLLPMTRAPAVRQDVTIEAYTDDRLPALSQPVAISTRSVSRVFDLSGAVLIAPDGVNRGDRYTVWSRAPRPSPAELAAAGTVLPPDVGRYLELGRSRFEPFGTIGREADTRARFDPQLHPELSQYAPLWRKARALTRKSSSPYEATIAVESWLRATGGFGYTESPPTPPVGVPPLVDFAMHTKLGYCQHYAGTMALMLRTLGIPSRVAVGLHERPLEGWRVGRDRPRGSRLGGGLVPRVRMAAVRPDTGSRHPLRRLHDRVRLGRRGAGARYRQVPPARRDPADGSTEGRRACGHGERVAKESSSGSLPRSSLLASALAAIPVSKSVRRRRRFRASDPRALATAARAELVDLLRDTGVDVDPSASVAELRAELRRLGVDASALANVVARARYAGLDEASRAAPEIEPRLDGIRKALRQRRGALASLRAAFAVRSLRRA